jgi:hypothetical protein
MSFTAIFLLHFAVSVRVATFLLAAMTFCRFRAGACNSLILERALDELEVQNSIGVVVRGGYAPQHLLCLGQDLQRVEKNKRIDSAKTY